MYPGNIFFTILHLVLLIKLHISKISFKYLSYGKKSHGNIEQYFEQDY